MKKLAFMLVLSTIFFSAVQPTVQADNNFSTSSVQLTADTMSQIVAGNDTGCGCIEFWGIKCCYCCLDLWIFEICIGACWPA